MELYTDDYFMGEALKEASRALEAREVPVGAVVVCQNKIIARGSNQTERLTDSTAHAEMLAMTSASNFLGSKYLDECTLYVTPGALRHVRRGNELGATPQTCFWCR